MGSEYRTKCGTRDYMGPEILEYLDTDPQSDEYTNAIDLWAVGCIAHRLVTGVLPSPSGRSLLKYCEDRSLFFDAHLGKDLKAYALNSSKKFLRLTQSGGPQLHKP